MLDGRGEQASHLSGRYEDGRLDTLATQQLPHSLGLLYESLTEHLGFLRSSDEFKVMALASYGRPRHLARFRETVFATDRRGGFEAPIPSGRSSRRPGRRATASGPRPRRPRPQRPGTARGGARGPRDVAACAHRWRTLCLAGGVALNCVANSRLWRRRPFEDVWVQPAAGDAGTSLGAALQTADLARDNGGDEAEPFTTAALGRGWS